MKGKSNSMKKKDGHLCATGRDNSTAGKKGYQKSSMGGSTSNLSHSIGGASATQKVRK